MHFLNRQLSKKYTDWDLKTTTISDYAVKFDIPENLYERFGDYIYENNPEYSDCSKVYAFKQFLRDEITKMLKEEKSIITDDESKLGIVDIQFTFKHFRLIPLMTSRGKAIWEQNHVRRREIEKKIIKRYSSMSSFLFLIIL